MKLNTLAPAKGSRPAKTRKGRGIGSGLGKTCGRGHKGQKSRAGGLPKPGFEGGQMPLQRRVPKFGFTSRKAKYYAQVRLSELNTLASEEAITLDILKRAGLVGVQATCAKVFQKGEIIHPITIKGIRVSKGAKLAIERAGGKVEA